MFPQKIPEKPLHKLWTNFYRSKGFSSNYKRHSGHTDQLMDEKDQQQMFIANNEGIIIETSS